MLVVFFSGVSNTTEKFVGKLNLPAKRIPLLPTDEPLEVDEDYILVTPTYGAGRGDAVPKQVIKFLNNESNRKHIKAVVGTGAVYFGDKFALAGDVVSYKCNVPHIHRVDLAGTPEDVHIVKTHIESITE